MLDLDNIRKEFARFLESDPACRWRMDAALAHVVTLAYRKWLEEGIQISKESVITKESACS